VSLAEFRDYYNNLSACIEDNTYFEAIIKNVWGIDTIRSYHYY